MDLPDLGIQRVKAKVDTGARTSALHAINILYVSRQGKTWVHFDVHPRQRNTKTLMHAEAPLIEERYVVDSGGRRTLRPVIETSVVLGGQRLIVELTLVARDTMGFRMLIGRQALKQQFIVDPGRSFLSGRPSTKVKIKSKSKRPRSPTHKASQP